MIVTFLLACHAESPRAPPSDVPVVSAEFGVCESPPPTLVEITSELLDLCVRTCRCQDRPLDVDSARSLCQAAGYRLATPAESHSAGFWCATDDRHESIHLSLPSPEELPPGPESWWANDATFRDGSSPYAITEPTRLAMRLQELAATNPDRVRLLQIGTSRLGQPILALRITDSPDVDEAEPAILFTGAHHGHELLTVLYALDSIQVILSDPASQRWTSELDLWFVPEVNPDGVWTTLYSDRRGESESGRKNGLDFARPCGPDRGARPGVDLNRNYPFRWGQVGSSAEPGAWNYRGPEPASEPETRALVELADKVGFVASISWHTSAGAILSPYTTPGVRSPDPDIAWSVAEAMAAATGQKYAVKHRLYPVSGVDQDWHYHEHGTIAFIVEGDLHNPILASRIQSSVDGVRPIWSRLLDRVLDGPRISGRVVDESGDPVEAVVTVEGLRTLENERWTSRADNGQFDRLTPGPGTYIVHATTEDGRWAEGSAEVSVGGVPRTLELRLGATCEGG